MNAKRKWQVARIRHNIPSSPSPHSSRVRDCVATTEDRVVIANECEESKISLCGRNDRSADRHDVSGMATQSLNGEEVSNRTAGDKSTNVRVSFSASLSGLRLTLISLIVFSLALTGFALQGWAAEANRFLVSYGGTAGYQLPLWVNKELGFSKKYGVDLEIVLIQAGSPNIQALLGGSIQLTQTAASSAVIGAVRGAPVVIVATLENKLPLQVTDSDSVEGTYEFFAKRLPRVPRTEPEGIRNILASIDAAKKDPADFLDMSLIDEIEREGFIQKLYGP
jgi:hypothetical protein